jgi:sugar phosphate isomerase/epimerase
VVYLLTHLLDNDYTIRVPESCRGPSWILWAGTVGFQSPLSQRFEAAAATGCTRVSLSPGDVIDGTETAALVAARASDLGLELILDPVMGWYPSQTASTSRFASVSADDALRVAEELGVVSMTAITTPGEPGLHPALPEYFARLCDRAAGFGAQVQIEFIPFTPLATLRQAWDLVAGVDRPNGGLLFDMWHFHRGEPDYDVLARVAGDKVFCVQLDDAPATAAADVRAETHHRLLPGDGELDLVRDLRALDAVGALRWIGPEVISPELAARPVAESAALAVSRSREVVAAALAGA